MTTSEFDTELLGNKAIGTLDNETGFIISVRFAHAPNWTVTLSEDEMERFEAENADKIRSVMLENMQYDEECYHHEARESMYVRAV